MPHKIYFIFGLFLFAISSSINAQESNGSKIQFGQGIIFRYGIGSLALKDELISKEKYTGTFPVYFVGWSGYNKDFGLNIYIKWENSSAVKDYNVTSNLSQSLIGISFYYPVGSISIFRRNLFFFLGPAAEMFQYNQTRNVTNYSAYNENALAKLASISITARAFYVINTAFMLEASGRLSLLSVANKTTSSLAGGTNTATAVLTTLYGFHSNVGINIRYHILSHITASAGYMFDLSQISEWDFFITAEDEFNAGISYNF